ncbi:hydroxyethylthiazole kinase [uncultured Bartonella sp.]|uniref:hydroxyethylthiazole kinase n=1 Tax=uncultured Bartonella sp. TaxID=104108 RepID=UPI00262ABA35|nr:hydroxyethylthiazole kinase [uncultured Bartonella sp.]
MFFEFDKRITIGNLRKKSPLVQCITNEVAMNFCANVVNAVGASPVMAFAPEEAADFVEKANALTVNIGTLTLEKYAGIRIAIKRAKKLHKPVVFDPVAHFATPFRQNAAEYIVSLTPAIIRGNFSEIAAFTGKTEARGVDSHDKGEKCFITAIELARKTKAVVAMSGKTDFITDGKNHFLIEGGDILMSKVSASGCALTCVTGAFLSLAPDKPLEAAIVAFASFAAAGKLAGKNAKGPGSFVPLFIDALATLDEEIVASSSSIIRWQNNQ